MQDGERREGRGGLLEGGKEGYEMCGERVSTLFLSRVICFASRCVYGMCLAREGYHPVQQHFKKDIGLAKKGIPNLHPLTAMEWI
jgi:hypothetical protein